MDPLSTAALISGGFGLFGGLISHGDVKEQYKYNKMLQDNAFAHNVEMWNMQNAYNTPSAQMERLQAAGLNPNLVYGNGGATNTATDYPKYQAGEAPQVANIRAASRQLALQGFQTALNAKLQNAQAANLNADTELKNKTTELTGVHKEIALLDKELRSGTLSSEIQYKVEKWKQDLILGRNQIELGGQQFTLNQKEMEKLDAETENIKQNTKLSEAQAEEIGIRIMFLPGVLRSQINLNSANAFNAIQAGNEHVATTALREAQTRIADLDKTLKGFDVNIKAATWEDIINNTKFKSLSAQEQYEILYNFGWAKAYNEVYANSSGIIGSIYNPIRSGIAGSTGNHDNPNHRVPNRNKKVPPSFDVKTTGRSSIY